MRLRKVQAPATRNRVAAKSGTVRPVQKTVDRQLLHELQTHQEELEAQNAQLRQTQAELAAALGRYTDLYNFAPVGFVTLDADGYILDANVTAATMFGLPRGQLLNANIRMLVAASDLNSVLAMLSSPHRKEQRRPMEVLLPENRIGEDRNVQFIALRAQGRIRLAIVDVTEVRRLEKAVAQASQFERERLRADLHDGLGQELTGLSLGLAALREEAQSSGLPWARQVEHLRAISSTAINTCRTIVHGLSPVAKSGGGLIPALESLAKRSRREGDPAIEIEVTERFPLVLDDAVADHVYRIAQETINNSLKHGHATAIRVTVTVLQKTLSVEIYDNGARHRAAASTVRGHGLDVMRFRARKIHGKLSILRSDRGTRIRCTCPNGSAAAAPPPG